MTSPQNKMTSSALWFFLLIVLIAFPICASNVQTELPRPSSFSSRILPTTSFVVVDTTAVGTSPKRKGINNGHRYPSSNWAAFMKRLGARTSRLFGVNGLGSSSSLKSFVGSSTWGTSLSSAPVTSRLAFSSAIAELRSPAGRSPASSASFSNPVKWSSIDANLATIDGADQASSSAENSVRILRALGMETLVVNQISCGSFDFSSVDVTAAAFWQDSYELYKHQYALARWSFTRGITDIEIYNEPDLNQSCLNATPIKFQLHVTLRSQAIRDAFSDLNSDVSSGALSCPSSSCPLSPSVIVGAFAKRTYSGDTSVYFGQTSVQNEHAKFPPQDRVFSDDILNFQAYSFHSYGKDGGQFKDAVSGLMTEIAKDLTTSILPVQVTEHNANTGSTWDGLSTTGDDASEATKLCGQIVASSLLGSDTYIFKFSATYSSSGGVAKTGIHWAENAIPPYHLADTTLAAECARLPLMHLQGALPLLAVTPNVVDSNVIYAAVKDGLFYYLYVVNDSSSSLPLDIDFSKWAPPSSSVIHVHEVSASARNEVFSTSITASSPSTSVKWTAPSRSTLMFQVPFARENVVSILPAADGYVKAGSKSATKFGTAAFLTAGTSITSDHSLTSASYLRFSVPSTVESSTITRALLSLTIETAWTASSPTTLQLLCLSPAAMAATVGSESWSSLTGVLLSPPVSVIDTIAENFVKWPSSEANLDITIAGHLHISSSNGAIGTTKSVDVTDCVKESIGRSVGFLLYRPFRVPTSTNTVPVPADDLSGGNAARFHSSDATSVSDSLKPNLVLYSASPTPAPSRTPTRSPIKNPAISPTRSPSKNPTPPSSTHSPSLLPTHTPTLSPSKKPTMEPTHLAKRPTARPSLTPTTSPQNEGSTSPPTQQPSQQPSKSPTSSPTRNTYTQTLSTTFTISNTFPPIVSSDEVCSISTASLCEFAETMPLASRVEVSRCVATRCVVVAVFEPARRMLLGGPPKEQQLRATFDLDITMSVDEGEVFPDISILLDAIEESPRDFNALYVSIAEATVPGVAITPPSFIAQSHPDVRIYSGSSSPLSLLRGSLVLLALLGACAAASATACVSGCTAASEACEPAKAVKRKLTQVVTNMKKREGNRGTRADSDVPIAPQNNPMERMRNLRINT